MPTVDVARAVLETRSTNAIVTGGEPLLQRAAVETLATHLKVGGRTIEVETNGTLVPSSALLEAVDRWNVSPKLSNSGHSLTERHNIQALQAFSESLNASFKFVVTQPSDFQEIDDFASRYSIPPLRIIVMPEGTSAKDMLERSTALADHVLSRGYRLTTRLHILLWGDVPGR